MCDKKTDKPNEQAPEEQSTDKHKVVFIEDRGGEARPNYATQGTSHGYHQSW